MNISNDTSKFCLQDFTLTKWKNTQTIHWYARFSFSARQAMSNEQRNMFVKRKRHMYNWRYPHGEINERSRVWRP